MYLIRSAGSFQYCDTELPMFPDVEEYRAAYAMSDVGCRLRLPRTLARTNPPVDGLIHQERTCGGTTARARQKNGAELVTTQAAGYCSRPV